jgi:dTMP kinase
VVDVFISFEGIDGSGKGTQVQLFLDYLKRNGIDFVYVREPGGTPIGELIRNILLSSQGMVPKTELFLFLASRAQLVETVIKPSLAQNKLVVTERFADSSVAYQGFARGLGVETVKRLNDFATGGLKPDLTFYIDVPVTVALSRKKHFDRIESEGEEFLSRVRQGYLELLKDEPERFVLIDGDLDRLTVHRFIVEEFEKRRRK